ncbi:hypothetical protein F3Y22_tig00112114pilonHSYRG00148 [Hibiscus syriacus]|uniref:NPH3 domain-containing protein n=1 Tax=Hibiscus syriacus TaxID=106335 RepID=A0A6A2X6D5_HIBSY|nr:hypothetical protein F3Y22_tig00112114pilonHSYRG00148 [Hibiscus syriacus]
MNCQKLSLEASTHATQNERLPLRFIVQVIFFEQLRLRTSITGCLFVSDNLENSRNPTGNNAESASIAHVGAVRDRSAEADDIKERISELEKGCLSMKEELEKLVKAKRGWNIFLKNVGFRSKSKSIDLKTAKHSSSEETEALRFQNISCKSFICKWK